jgi:hypothetical protein
LRADKAGIRGFASLIRTYRAFAMECDSCQYRLR